MRENIKINCIFIAQDIVDKLDNVYFSVSVNDEPFHTVKEDALTSVYRTEGKSGLYREMMRLLYSKVQLVGNDKSLDKYCYAFEKARKTDICNEYLDKINDLYYQLSDEDKKLLSQNILNDNLYNYRQKCEQLKYELYSQIGLYCEEYDKNRIFALYKNDIIKLSPNKIRRFNAIEYVCSFPEINPYEMAKSLVMDGYDINFDDSSITKDENIYKASELARYIGISVRNNIVIDDKRVTLKELLSQDIQFSSNQKYNFFKEYHSWEGVTFKEILGLSDEEYELFTCSLSDISDSDSIDNNKMNNDIELDK